MRNRKKRIEDLITEETVICKCGHSIFLPNIEPVKICSHCNRIVYKNDKAKFEFLISKKRRALERG